MSTKDDGGPAFPAPDAGEEHFSQRSAYMGMSLRDYFAAHAPLESLKFQDTNAAAKFASLPPPENDEELIALGMAIAAKASFIYADAMLEARKK